MTNLRKIHWSSLPGPEDITRIELENGITVLVRTNFNSPSVVVQGILKVGSIHDSPEKLGLANFTAMSLMKGTRKHSFQQIYEMLESVGASLGYNAGGYHTSFGGKALAEDLPLLVNLLAESILEPVFPDDQIERLRGQILSALAVRDQDTESRASMRFDKIIFGKHPYGQPGDGFSKTIQAILRDDILSFHQKNYSPEGMVLVIVGSVDPSFVVDIISQNFSGWNPAKTQSVLSHPAPRRLRKTIQEHIFISGKSQVDIVMGTLGPDRNSPHFHAASLGNSILGQFGMMGRIGDAVREKAGLAYHASTNLNALLDTGSWEILAGVNPNNVAQAVLLIKQELEKFISDPVTQEELEDNQSEFIGKIPLALESNYGVASAILNIERFGLGLDYYQKYPDKINSITREEILTAARTFINPEKLAIISAGPKPERGND